MLLTDVSNIFCYDESFDEKKIEKYYCVYGLMYTRGRMRGRMGNANGMEIKKKVI